MAEYQRSGEELRALVMAELQALPAVQHLRADIDPEVEANPLRVLVNGISLDSLIQAQCLSLEQQRQVVQRYVGELQ